MFAALGLSVCSNAGAQARADSEVTLTPYAQIIVNAGMNTGTAAPSQEAPVGAPAGSNVGDGLPTDGSFVLTSRQSRVGLKGQYVLENDLDATATVEIDFWGLHEDGGPTGITQPGPRLRLGYADIGGKSWRVFAGQTWSVVTPRLPMSISHSAIVLHTGSGALWQRLPQLGVSLDQALDGGEGEQRLGVKLAVVRSVSGEPGAGVITRADNADPGAASQLPGGEAHAGYESKLFAFGVGGRFAREKFLTVDAAGVAGDVSVSSWLASLDAKLTTDWFWLGGQGWTGENLNGMFSRQGVLLTRGSTDPAQPAFAEVRDVEALPAMGGWVELGVPVVESLKIVASVGAEVGDEDKLPVGAAKSNLGLFGGVFYSPVKRLTTSLEYYRTDTRYRAVPGAPDELRQGLNDNLTLNAKLEL
ncbi:MAG: hypothetical protein KC766_21690 [Myxococcales bacterium]|nr:hypothetical protein [Myxococcales bacterium]